MCASIERLNNPLILHTSLQTMSTKSSVLLLFLGMCVALGERTAEKSSQKELLGAVLLTPDLSAFNFSAGGRYVAEGNVWFNVQWPFQTPLQGPMAAQLAVDPVDKIITFWLPPRYQFQLANDFYYGDASGCYRTPGKTYDEYVFLYQQMRNWQTQATLSGIVKSWEGSVKDPGFAGNYGTVVAQTNRDSQVQAYAFQQTLVIPFFPFFGANAKVSGTMVFNRWTHEDEPIPALYRNLPAACLPPNIVKDYASSFYPATYNPPYPV